MPPGAKSSVRARKIPYYLGSIYSLAAAISNPIAPLGTIAGRLCTLKFRDGLLLTVHSPLDLLVAKETLLDDAYRLTSLSRAERIIDIGASVGDFSLAAARRFPDAEILSFEPNPLYLQTLHHNINQNGVTNVTVFGKAVGRGEQACLMSSLLESRVSLLKMDCEGNELEILAGLETEHLRRIDRIALEYHRHADPDLDRKISRVLESAGFKCDLIPDRYTTETGYLFARLEEEAI